MQTLIDIRSTAIAYHNGTILPLGSVAASAEYQDLLAPILTKAGSQGTQKSQLRCPDLHPKRQDSAFDESFLGFLGAVSSWPVQRLKKMWTEQQAIEIPAPHPVAELFRKELLSLPSFKNMDSQQLSQLAVGLTIPSWLFGSPEACHLIEVARNAFHRVIVESAPSSAYTAAGYELCRISYEDFECTGPGRIMTLECDEGTAVASMMQTPALSFADLVMFSISMPKGSAQWIDSVIREMQPQKVMLVGSEKAPCADAVAGVSDLLVSSPSPQDHLLAFGAARSAKELLESQGEDCHELEECEELTRQADAIAGSYMPFSSPASPVPENQHTEL